MRNVLVAILCFVGACATASPEAREDDDGPWCGDRVCNGDESATRCPADCAAAPECGDGICNGSETINTCAQDCSGGGGGAVCGDGHCNGVETSTTCAQDCTVAPVCGDGNCNGGETTTSCAEDCGGGGGGGGGGTCAHDVCTSGVALSTGCDACAASVCSVDSYCCTTSWDSACVTEVDTYCAAGTCGGGGGGGTCDHDECTVGGALSTSCSACVASICAADSFCCSTSWDSACVGEVPTYCGTSCGGGGGTCAHDECTIGGALSSSCSSCASSICAVDSFCCTTSWDSACVSEVTDYCAVGTCP